MKLLRFLERRLKDAPSPNTLHKWIRSGQVRINGGRAKAFSLLAEGDLVRIPPFAAERPLSGLNAAGGKPGGPLPEPAPGDILPGPEAPGLLLQAVAPDLLILSKPAGLPCQPGSGHQDSVSSRLAKAYSQNVFIPAPAHRIDRGTSGLLLAGRSHRGQQWLHELFRTGGVRKEYLAWVKGDWPHPLPCLLLDSLAQARDPDGKERTRVLPGGATSPIRQNGGTHLPVLSESENHNSLCIATAVQRISIQRMSPAGCNVEESGSLLLVLLLTGRKHQIRAQAASRGFPVIGDLRYGVTPFPQMLLHAFALGLPPTPWSTEPCPQPSEYSLMPDWPSPFEPDDAALASAREKIRAVEELLAESRPWRRASLP